MKVLVPRSCSEIYLNYLKGVPKSNHVYIYCAFPSSTEDFLSL